MKSNVVKNAKLTIRLQICFVNIYKLREVYIFLPFTRYVQL